jgi:hypothetical protein
LGEAFVFDAESAVDVVASVFDVIDMQRWDEPMMTLPDRAAVELFLRGRGLSLESSQQAAEGFSTPMTVTKRGVLCGRPAGGNGDARHRHSLLDLKFASGCRLRS